MKVKTIGVLFTVLLFVFVTGLPAYGAQGGESGPPDNGGPPDGVGPPEGTMLDVKGCAYFDEVLAVWRLRAPDTELGYPNCLPEADTDWKIDFGPEGYCPDPCLTGDLITDELNGTEPVEIKIGMNYVGTFKWSSDDPETRIILVETDPDGPARGASYGWIILTPAEGTNYGRPIEGKWVRVFGRAGETEYAVLVWELRYPNTPNLPTDYGKWFWWRSSGQPWAKMWLLDCVAPGEEEVPTGGGSGSGGGGKGKK